MDSDIISEQTYSVGERRLRYRLLPRDRSARRANHRLSRGSSLVVISLFSLGLWAAISAVVSSLAGIWLR